VTTARPTRGRIIVFGILFGYPLAGVTYQFLHYLVALRRLGYDPYYVEDSGRWVYNPWLHETTRDASHNVRVVAPILAAHGFGDRWAFRGRYADGPAEQYGLSAARLAALFREADAFLNVTASQEILEEHLQVPRRIYVESDPFAAQVRLAQGDAFTTTQLARHDTHFSFGENIGAPDCTVPTAGLRWLPTRQPVVLDLWDGPQLAAPGPAPDAAYRTITTWGNSGNDVVHEGDTYYWTKDRAFEPYLDLPRRRAVPFEIAVSAKAAVHARLGAHGWAHPSALHVSEDAARYRAFIQGARAEFTVARDQYVRPRTGWFSDRSACYLAAGRPVVTEDTGFGCALPTGRGLFAFRTMDDVLGAIDAIEGDYAGHCGAAREIAAECFDAERVVGSLMARAGL
jgi:hypothetical protein